MSEDEALRALDALAAQEPELVEQPVSPDDPDALARVRRASPVPVAADESVRDVASARALLADEAVDALVVKPGALGGLRAAARIAAEARAAGVAVVVTSLLDGAVGRAAATQLAAALPPPIPDCGLATGTLLGDDVADLAGDAEPELPLPSAPGLGTAPSPAALRRLARGAPRQVTA